MAATLAFPMHSHSTALPTDQNRELKCTIGVISITENITSKIGYKIIQQIETALISPEIHGILLHIDSGGGNAGTSALIKRSLEELSKVKPVITLVENICASGAYTIATGTQWIIANYAADIGGIGIIRIINRHKKNQKLSIDGRETEVTYELFYKGKEKVICDSLADELTENERAIINTRLEQHYQEFCSVISKARNLPLEKSSEWAEGKVFYGFQAIGLGLIDEVGGFPEAKAYFKKAFAHSTDVDVNLTFSLLG